MLSIFISLAFSAALAFSEVVHHSLNVRLNPATHEIWGRDEIRLGQVPRTKIYEFTLNDTLRVTSIGAKKARPGVWRIPLSGPSVTIEYEGSVYDAVHQDNSSGLIDSEGVTLMGSSLWYPARQEDMLTFDLQADLPKGWSFVTQSSSATQPQEEIYLIAGRFNRYDKSGHSVFLRQADQALADGYLDLLPDYLKHYSALIAPYPYGTFRVVENFFETGFGMPSFTLLGPSVIRLPFLLKSSFPHEVLHNWWGNSVYVDWERGNWSEGLTTYLADHWQQELAGTAAEYRRQALATFQDFVREENDFPLRQFKGRHDAGSQAVGYGKSMFMFHMLKQHLGELQFTQTLREFYRNNVFRKVSFEEIQSAAEAVSGGNLDSFFAQWLDRTGMPSLKLDKAARDTSQRSVQLTLSQSSPGASIYDLLIPVQLSLVDGSEVRSEVRLNQTSQSFELKAEGKILKVAVDPGFDIFRSLSDDERPPTLSRAFSGSNISFVAGSPQKDSELFIQTWKNSGVVGAVWGGNKIPETGNVVFLGSSELAETAMSAPLADYGVRVQAGSLFLDGVEYPLKEHTFALAGRLSTGQNVLWILWPPQFPVEVLARRLLHYGSFGAVVFNGNANALKKAWPVVHSPLSHQF